MKIQKAQYCVVQYMSDRKYYFLHFDHELLKNLKVEDATILRSQRLVKSVDFKTSFQKFHGTPEVVKIKVFSVLRIGLLKSRY